MYINPETGTIFETHSAIRAAWYHVGFGPSISDEELEFIGLRRVAIAPRPALKDTQRAERAPAAEVDGVWTVEWTVRDATAAEMKQAAADLKAAIAMHEAQIDDAAAERINASTRFAMGYEQRESAALTFRAAGYEGDPTTWVSRFAGNVGMTNRAAADLILSQAAVLRAALAELENLRMDKYLVRAAKTVDQADEIAFGILAAIAAVITS